MNDAIASAYHEALVVPTDRECLHQLGAEYIGALLEGDTRQALRLAKVLIVFAIEEAKKQTDRPAHDAWPPVLSEIMPDVLRPRPDEEKTRLMTHDLVHLDISEADARRKGRTALSSVTSVSRRDVGSLAEWLVTGRILVDGEPLEL